MTTGAASIGKRATAFFVAVMVLAVSVVALDDGVASAADTVLATPTSVTDSVRCNVAYRNPDNDWANYFEPGNGLGWQVMLACQYWMAPGATELASEDRSASVIAYWFSDPTNPIHASQLEPGSGFSGIDRDAGYDEPGRIRLGLASTADDDDTQLVVNHVCVYVGSTRADFGMGGNPDELVHQCASAAGTHVVTAAEMVANDGFVPMPDERYVNGSAEPAVPPCAIEGVRIYKGATVTDSALAWEVDGAGSMQGPFPLFYWQSPLDYRLAVKLSGRFSWVEFGRLGGNGKAQIQGHKVVAEANPLDPVDVASPGLWINVPDVLHGAGEQEFGLGCGSYWSQYDESLTDCVNVTHVWATPGSYCTDWLADRHGIIVSDPPNPSATASAAKKLGQCLSELMPVGADLPGDLDLWDVSTYIPTLMNFFGNLGEGLGNLAAVALNPITYGKATICVLQWAFVPQTPMSVFLDQVRAAGDGTVLVSIGSVAADLLGAPGVFAAAADDDTGCIGPSATIENPKLGPGVVVAPLNACEGHNADLASKVRTFLALTLIVGATSYVVAAFVGIFRTPAPPGHGGEKGKSE